MLVLSRKTDQSLQIAENIVIKVLSIQGSTVRIGIIAPRSVRVLRQELLQHSTAVCLEDMAECTESRLTASFDEQNVTRLSAA